MKVCGLTGGVGMGKSAAAQVLQDRGACIVDTDLLARQLVQPHQPALIEIQRLFGNALIDASGYLRRDELARIVFSDPEARRKVEAILHPLIRSLWQAQLQRWRAEQRELAVVVIPLLFETAAESEFDFTICLACSSEAQRSRLRTRGWNDGQIAQRIAAQWPIGDKMAKADYVIWTEGSLEITAEQLRRIEV
ncbi:MAG: dephospho-CoA kinase [Akkermansiaceae bacterium]|nr:dephospho-CoA kinase [Verrucomicrobiales bacterium]